VQDRWLWCGSAKLLISCWSLLYKVVAASRVLPASLRGARDRWCATQVRLRIDDPLESSAVHLGSGLLGLLWLGLAARPDYVSGLNSDDGGGPSVSGTGGACGGAFYASTLGAAGGIQFGVQVLGEARSGSMLGTAARARVSDDTFPGTGYGLWGQGVLA
jgi:hypothetical protein